MATTERRCRECGVGMIRPATGKGRRAQYKNLELEVPEDLAIPTCDHCGARWFDRSSGASFDSAMEKAFVKALTERVRALIAQVAARAPMRKVESLLGLSEGYLSKVKQGRSQASAHLVSTLGLLASTDVNRGLDSLEKLWTQRPGAAFTVDLLKTHKRTATRVGRGRKVRKSAGGAAV